MLNATQQARLLAKFAAQRPGARDLSIQALEEIEGGWERPIYYLRLQFNEGGQIQEEMRVLRSYAGADSESQARKDFAIMTQVQQQGLPTPGLNFVLGADDADADDTGANDAGADDAGANDAGASDAGADDAGEALLVMDYVEGQQAVARLRAGDADLLAQLASYQAALHGLDWRGLWAWETIPEAESYVEARLSALEAQVGALGGGEFAGTLAWLQAHRGEAGDAEIGLLHNDYHPENVLVRDRDGAAFIVDWGFAAPGEPRMDLAWSLLQISIMLGVEARQHYLAAYEQARGRRVQGLAFFEALKFAERMATIVSWLQPGAQPPIPKISQEAIRSTYKVHVLNVYERMVEITGARISQIEAL